MISWKRKKIKNQSGSNGALDLAGGSYPTQHFYGKRGNYIDGCNIDGR